MNTIKIKTVFAIIVLSFGTFSVMAQSQSQKNEERIQIYTSEERDNLQLWFHDQTDQMNLTEEAKEQYLSIILHYTGKIMRLDDKDKGLTKEEFVEKLEEYIGKQNNKVKGILTAEQYAIHLKNYGILMRSASKRWGIG